MVSGEAQATNCCATSFLWLGCPLPSPKTCVSLRVLGSWDVHSHPDMIPCLIQRFYSVLVNRSLEEPGAEDVRAGVFRDSPLPISNRLQHTSLLEFLTWTLRPLPQQEPVFHLYLDERMSLVGLPTPCPNPVKFLSAECVGHRLCPRPAEGAIAMLSQFTANSPCWPLCTGRSSAACHSCPHTLWAQSSRCSHGRPGLQGVQHRMKRGGHRLAGGSACNPKFESSWHCRVLSPLSLLQNTTCWDC